MASAVRTAAGSAFRALRRSSTHSPDDSRPVPAGVIIVALVATCLLWPGTADAHGLVGRAYLPVPALLGYPAWIEPVLGLLGVAVFVIVIVCGVRGSQIPTANLAPTAIYVLFWVGTPILSAFFGDVFRPFNPWRAIARAGAWGARRLGLGRSPDRPPLPYPERLGRWPAVAGIVAFAWLELVFVNRERPATLAVLASAYALVQWVGMAYFGIDRWSER